VAICAEDKGFASVCVWLGCNACMCVIMCMCCWYKSVIMCFLFDVAGDAWRSHPVCDLQ